MSVLEFLLLLLVAGVCGSLAQSLVDYSHGGCLVSIVLGFIGAILGSWLAQKLGLVDKLGTLDDAVAHAQQLAGLKGDDKVERLILPKPVSPFESLFGPLDPDAGAKAAGGEALWRGLDGVAPELSSALRSAALVGRLSQQGPMTLQPFQLRVR